MSKLALNVADIDEAIVFYSKLFATEPAKVRPGYANFAVADPPLKLVLIEDAARRPGRPSTTSASRSTSTDEVAAAQSRLADAGLATAAEDEVDLLLRGPGQGLGRRTPRRRPGRSTPCSPTRRCQTGIAGDGRAARSRADPAQPPAPSPPRPAADTVRRCRDRRHAMNDVALWRRLLAEFLGSAFLAALVIGSGIAAQQLSPGNIGLQLFENAAATAAGLFAIILMFGPVSGGHFNPVVSFVDAAFGGLSWRDAAAYLPAQLAGCVGGAVVANVMFSKAAFSISTKHRASAAALPLRGRRHPRAVARDLRLGPLGPGRRRRPRSAPTSAPPTSSPLDQLRQPGHHGRAACSPTPSPGSPRRRRRRSSPPRSSAASRCCHQSPVPRRHPGGSDIVISPPRATPTNGRPPTASIHASKETT